MERLSAAPAAAATTAHRHQLHDSQPPHWTGTLPHLQANKAPLQYNNYQAHPQQHPQQHSRSHSTSGREAHLNTSLDSGSWRPTDNAGGHPTPPPTQQHHDYPTPSSTQHYTPSQLNTSSSNLNTSFGGLSSSSVPLSSTGPPPVSRPLPVAMEQKKEVKLNSMEWFHGSISRDEAEKLLQPREDGLFLVRGSTNFPGDYTLCVCYQAKVEHYRVIQKSGQLTIDEEEFYDNLTLLVEHYEQDADGLCTKLMRALPKQDSAEKAFKDAGWVINRNELQIGDSIGKGEFGDVLLGDWLGRKVAVKRLKDNCQAARQLLDEASLMTNLTHENLVNLLGLVFEGSCILLLTEFMSKGSLVDYLRSRGRLHVTKKDQINFAYDTAAGMAYLESRRVVHRDLAARNVLISQDDTAKVCDFGLAKSISSKIDGVKFPIKWTAPEALRHNQLFSSKSDMWSFGILLWEIYSFGRVPYPKIPLADVTKHVERGYRMDPPDNCPAEVYKLMEESWRSEPDERPSFSKVLDRLLDIKEATRSTPA